MRQIRMKKDCTSEQQSNKNYDRFFKNRSEKITKFYNKKPNRLSTKNTHILLHRYSKIARKIQKQKKSQTFSNNSCFNFSFIQNFSLPKNKKSYFFGVDSFFYIFLFYYIIYLVHQMQTLCCCISSFLMAARQTAYQTRN